MISGLPSLASFEFIHDRSLELNTRFVIEMLRRGFLGFRQFKPSLAHTEEEMKRYKEAVSDVFKLLSSLSDDKIISSPIAQKGFYRLTKE